MEKIKVISSLAPLNQGSDKGSSHTSCKTIYFCSREQSALVRAVCPYVYTVGEERAAKGSGTPSLIPGIEELGLSETGKFQDKEHKCSHDLKGRELISRIEEISAYLRHGFQNYLSCSDFFRFFSWTSAES